MKKPELISPAGDLEKMKIAFQYGADAVYASTPKFSMRSRSEIKFDDKSLKEGIGFAHSIGKKVYLTLNTFPHSSEIDDFKRHALKTIKYNPDAIICADPGVIDFIKNHTNIPIHLSTQSNTTNYLSANFWKNQGINRIVLARELNLKDIDLISKKTKVELEAFVHGAMCMAYSGRCQISNYMIGRDPNKGQCIQACRFKYKFKEYEVEEELREGEKFKIYEDDHGTYLLNSKDLCMIDHIPDLINSGITSFKLEGRLKSIYYVGIVTRAYRQAIDLYFKDHKKYDIQKQAFVAEVSKTSSRGFTTGFYYQKPNEETNDYKTSRAGSDWEFVGLVKKYNMSEKTVLVEVRNRLRTGADIEIVTPEKVYMHNLTEMICKDKKIDEAHAGYIVEFGFKHSLPQNSFIRQKKIKE